MGEWKPRTKEVELPSGRKVTIRPLGIRGMMAVYGGIPDFEELEQQAARARDKDYKPSASDRQRFAEQSIATVCNCSVSPRFSEEPRNGEISVDDLTQTEFWALSRMCTEYTVSCAEEEKKGVDPS